jgi:hypothetical protein
MPATINIPNVSDTGDASSFFFAIERFTLRWKDVSSSILFKIKFLALNALMTLIPPKTSSKILTIRPNDS